MFAPVTVKGSVLKAYHSQKYSAFLFLRERSSANSTDQTSKDVKLPGVWLQGSALPLKLHFNLKILKKPFANRLQLRRVTAARTLLPPPCATLLWPWWSKSERVYPTFQGQTKIANGILDLHSFSRYRCI